MHFPSHHLDARRSELNEEVECNSLKAGVIINTSLIILSIYFVDYNLSTIFTSKNVLGENE